MPDRAFEHRSSPAQAVAGIEQAINLRAVPRPFFDLIEVAIVRIERVVGFFVGPIVGHCSRRSASELAVLSFQLRFVRSNKCSNIVRHVQQLQPLLFI